MDQFIHVFECDKCSDHRYVPSNFLKITAPPPPSHFKGTGEAEHTSYCGEYEYIATYSLLHEVAGSPTAEEANNAKADD